MQWTGVYMMTMRWQWQHRDASSDDSADTMAAQHGHSGTQDGSMRQSSRAWGQRLAAVGLGQAQAARPAKRGGTADHAGHGHVHIMGRPRGDRAPCANQHETSNAHKF